jgi:hypothetical protein
MRLMLRKSTTDCLPGYKSETNTIRQVTQHGCLPNLQGDGDKRIEIMYCTVRKKIFCTGPTEQLRQNKNLLYRHDKPNEPTKKGHLSFVLFESPFTSVSTVSRGHPSFSLIQTEVGFNNGSDCALRIMYRE